MGPSFTRAGIVVIVSGLFLAACASGGDTAPSANATGPTLSASPTPHHRSPEPSQAESPVPAESPIPTESSPPGDIPDDIQFVPYRSNAGGFTISVPEGWSRLEKKTSVMFTDKLNTIGVAWTTASTAPSVASAKRDDVAQLRASTLAFRLTDVTTTSLPAGPAVLISYQENSAPNAVTGKQYRDEVLRYELFRGGTELILTLGSPVGSDNVDPWRVVTQSLRWR